MKGKALRKHKPQSSFSLLGYYDTTVSIYISKVPGTRLHVFYRYLVVVELPKNCYMPGTNLNTSDSGLHHTISLMYVGARHLGFGTNWHDRRLGGIGRVVPIAHCSNYVMFVFYQSLLPNGFRRLYFSVGDTSQARSPIRRNGRVVPICRELVTHLASCISGYWTVFPNT